MSDDAGAGTQPPLTTAGVLKLGAVAGLNTLIGDIAELIVYDRALSHLEQVLVENYLSAKYDITIVKENYYDEDEPSNGNYDFDVAGIGRVNASDLHTNSEGSGVFTMLNPQNLDDNEYCIWGQNGQTLFPTEYVDVPPTVTSRSNRVWRASEVDPNGNPVDVGAVDIRFNLTGISIATSQLRLLVDTDNDGVFIDETPQTGATLVSGNLYQFAGVTSLQNNLRFTAGFVGVVLPIKLLRFNVAVINRTVNLSWETATEINNDYFTIERSYNGIDFSPIKEIKGAGNSNNILKYSAIDKFTADKQGIFYYRLKQTDFDGKFSYSKIKSAIIDVNIVPLVQIHPNPTNGEFILSGNENELKHIKLFNTMGKDLTNAIKITKKDNVRKIVIDNLSPGIYYLKMKTTTLKVIKK